MAFGYSGSPSSSSGGKDLRSVEVRRLFFSDLSPVLYAC